MAKEAVEKVLSTVEGLRNEKTADYLIAMAFQPENVTQIETLATLGKITAQVNKVHELTGDQDDMTLKLIQKGEEIFVQFGQKLSPDVMQAAILAGDLAYAGILIGDETFSMPYLDFTDDPTPEAETPITIPGAPIEFPDPLPGVAPIPIPGGPIRIADPLPTNQPQEDEAKIIIPGAPIELPDSPSGNTSLPIPGAPIRIPKGPTRTIDPLDP